MSMRRRALITWIPVADIDRAKRICPDCAELKTLSRGDKGALISNIGSDWGIWVIAITIISRL